MAPAVLCDHCALVLGRWCLRGHSQGDLCLGHVVTGVEVHREVMPDRQRIGFGVNFGN